MHILNSEKFNMATKKTKFTFKLHPKSTGLSAVGNTRQGADVKLNKQVIGTIHAPNWQTKDNKYSVSFAVKSEDKNCGWSWVRLKQRTDTIEQMKEWLNEFAGLIVEKYEFHILDSE